MCILFHLYCKLINSDFRLDTNFRKIHKAKSCPWAALLMIRAYKPVLSTQGVRSIIHPLCGCATNVIQKNHLRVIMWLFKLHCNERKVTFMANKTNSLSHTKWMCKYHIVFSPKYRRKIIYNQYRKSLQDIIRTLCRYKGVEIIEGHMMPDHVHLVLSIPPKISVSNFMGYLKGKSALMMFESMRILSINLETDTFGLKVTM